MMNEINETMANVQPRLFNTPQEYLKVTGKRFRLTADQKADVNSGKITRQEAFESRYDELAAMYQPKQSN